MAISSVLIRSARVEADYRLQAGKAGSGGGGDVRESQGEALACLDVDYQEPG